MILNRLGKTDIYLSSMGMGTWAIGGGGYEFGWGAQDDTDSIATIRHAVELGINWIDTAPVYGLGHSEEVVGQAVKGIRDKVVISSKCGFRWDENRKIFSSLKKESIRTEIEASLRRLNIDVIDLYQIHKPIPENEIEEAWSVVVDLIKEGKIRFAGVSSFSLEQLTRIHSIHPVAFFQPEYNMLVPTIQEDGLLDFCGANKIGVIVYSPMCMGFLTGKYTREKVESLPADDSRLAELYFQQPYLDANLQLVERLRPIAERNNKSVAHLAIAWVLRRPEVTSAIVGARRPSQIEETTPAGDWVLSKEDRLNLDKILAEHQVRLKELKVGVEVK